MRKYLIEREVPGAGTFTDADLEAMSRKSCSVIEDLGPDIRWLHSYVTGDKIYCVYQSTSEDLIRRHAVRGGFPVNAIAEIGTVIGPAGSRLARDEEDASGCAAEVRTDAGAAWPDSVRP